MLNGKDTIIHLIAGYIKKDIILISGYFPEPKYSGGRMKFKLDLSNYATKADLKNATGVDTANLVDTVDLVNLKPDIG